MAEDTDSTPTIPDEYPGSTPGIEKRKWVRYGSNHGWDVGGACHIKHVRGEVSAAIYAVSKVEGTYDNVQTYDDAVLTYGILQWTIHAGSLQRLLYHLKHEAGDDGRAAFEEHFGERGLDVHKRESEYEISFEGTVYKGAEQWHAIIRADQERAEKWCSWFNAAGKDERVRKVQFARARLQYLELQEANLEHKVDFALKKCPSTFFAKYKGKYDSAGRWTRPSPKAAVLHFSMCDNNPGYGHAALLKAIDAFHDQYGADENAWPQDWPNQLGDLMEAKCKETLKTWANHVVDDQQIEGRVEKTLRYWDEARAAQATS